MGEYAWVTLATNDAYSLGALVLAHSLRRVGTKYDLAALVTPGVTQTMREKLSAVFSVVMEVNVLDSKDEANLALLARPELGITFTKLHCWRLTQYKKCVFLDADTLVVRNCDELFEREELSAAPDVGWPDCFNSGVFVYTPSQQTFASITAFAAAKGSFDGGDQGLLNMYFSDWARKDISKHLPFIYNMCSTATYSYLPAFKQFGDDVRIIHFIGITKPWLQYFDTLTGIVQPPMGSAHLQPLLQLWWNIFCEKVHPQLSPVMATSTLAPIWHEFSPVPFQSPVPKHPIYTDIQDKAQSDIYSETPDFSEFKDPWENYCIQNDPVIYKKGDNNGTQQYYSTIDRSSPITLLSNEFNSKSVHQSRYESSLEHNRQLFHKQQYNECNSPPLHIQQHHNQEPNHHASQNNQQKSFFHSENTSITKVHYWQNDHSIETYVPVHSTQTHHSNNSQQQHEHVKYQYTYQRPCNNDNKLLLEETKQHRHVDCQSTYHHSHNDSNKTSPERAREYQNVEHQYTYQDFPNNKMIHQHNDYQHNQYHHVYDTVNNEQAIQHYEQKNQVVHSNKQSDFECKQNEFLNVVHYNQITEDNIVHQSDFSIKQNTEQTRNVNITDERTNTVISTSPHPVSKPCTDIHNVATQSDLHIMEDSSNAGLAGALAQMTLGEPRSAEQIALEEHMRKQSWEQGQIDYMGRDSFDNIWKKICQTLALAPPRLPSPPKEIQKSIKTTTDKTAESIQSAGPIDSTRPVESIDEVDKGIAQTTSHIEEQSLVNNVPIASNNNIISKLSKTNEQVIGTPSAKTNENKQTISEEILKDTSQKSSTRFKSDLHDTIGDSTQPSMQTFGKTVEEVHTSSMLKDIQQETIKDDTKEPSRSSQLIETPQNISISNVSNIEPSNLVQPCLIGEQKDELSCNKEELASSATDVRNLEVTVDVQQTKQSDIRNEKHAKELSTASEVLTTSPVPIQVAESVLQVEAKESMSDSQVINQEVLSSTITPVHESNICYSETSINAENKVQINGSASTIDSAQKQEKLSLGSVKAAESTDTANQFSELSTQSAEASKVLSPIEEPCLTETSTSLSNITTSVETPEMCVDKRLEQTTEQLEKAESCTKESIKPSSECAVTETSLLGECPVRPLRAKELNVPSTSDPETPLEESKVQEKVKKVTKKSIEKSTSEEPAETTEGDNSGKKIVKKVVKKVTKKPKSKPEEALDDTMQDSTSVSKQKKTTKVVKKGSKSLQTSDTDTVVSETPSSSTSDTPVPPKRKSKTTTTKPTIKKSDVE